MAQTYPVAGRLIFMGGLFVPPAMGLLTADDFSDVTSGDWTPIAKWASTGALGGDQQTITQPYINEDYEDVQMGTKNPGTMSNTFGVIAEDPGQIKCYAAAGDKRLREFMIVFPDAPVGANAHGSIRLFAAYVKEPVEQGGEANTTGMVEIPLVKYRNTVRLPASETGGPIGGA
ncbi:hypothetical protein [Limoniibacter endophyticus]|uniref:Uncharacterized protein n=1 Tax=Limoniibacter endophyticus TaxID=1565040 RepID=A0A8J3DSZ6_9HYPH|nr:hypothetical protein [Limoniibacter endophyticus]GHC79376.1 hypothetical protein GCM10010136_31870 [Limoniibacter endophyticus]